MQGKNLEGVSHVKQQSGERGGGGGVKCDLIYPFTHQNDSEAESQGEAFRALFRD